MRFGTVLFCLASFYTQNVAAQTASNFCTKLLDSLVIDIVESFSSEQSLRSARSQYCQTSSRSNETVAGASYYNFGANWGESSEEYQALCKGESLLASSNATKSSFIRQLNPQMGAAVERCADNQSSNRSHIELMTLKTFNDRNALQSAYVTGSIKFHRNTNIYEIRSTGLGECQLHGLPSDGYISITGGNPVVTPFSCDRISSDNYASLEPSTLNLLTNHGTITILELPKISQPVIHTKFQWVKIGTASLPDFRTGGCDNVVTEVTECNAAMANSGRIYQSFEDAPASMHAWGWGGNTRSGFGLSLTDDARILTIHGRISNCPKNSQTQAVDQYACKEVTSIDF